jgi:hypothetical protein
MKKYLGIYLIVVIAVAVMFPAVPCQAASAKVNIMADSAQVTVGDTVNVYIKIDSGTTFEDFEADLTYDKDILEYQSGASVITGGSGYLKISDMGSGQLDSSRKYALEFKADKVGDCNIAFSGQVMVYDNSGIEMPVSSESVTISVKAQKTASTNTNLKSLETSPVDITPIFDKKVTEYSVNVSNDTEKLLITAIPEDEKASVSITGNDFLHDGENKIVITVLAESGDIIEYTINVSREAAPTVTVQPAAPSDSNEAKFEILKTESGTIYLVYRDGFKLVEPGSDIIIPEGYSRSEITVSGVAITAFVSDSNPESDIVLLYAEDATGKAGFYQFDKIQNTLQLYVPVTIDNDKNSSDLNKGALTIAILSALCVLLFIAVVWLFLKRRQVKKNDWD